MNDIKVTDDNRLHFMDSEYRCAVGRAGFVRDKREGDHATPVGRFALRQLFYRPDRLDPPRTQLPVEPLSPDLGWCDDPADRRYNRLVRLPYPASHEALWRGDALYDLIVVIGYNDSPPRPAMGSAIFLHVARDDFTPTEGCIAVAKPDLLSIVKHCGPQTAIIIGPE